MPDVLRVTAFEVGDPVLLFILMKADDAALDRGPVSESQCSYPIDFSGPALRHAIYYGYTKGTEENGEVTIW